MASSAASPNAVEDEFAAFPVVAEPDEFAAFPKVEDDEFAAFPKVERAAEVTPQVVAQEAEKATIGAVQALDVMGAPRRLDWSDVNEKLDAERFYESESLKAQAAQNPQQAPALMAQSEQLRSGITPFTTTGQKVLQSREGEVQGMRESLDTMSKEMSQPGILKNLAGPAFQAQFEPMVDAAAQASGPAISGALGAAAFLHPGAAALRFVAPVVGGLMGSQMGGAAQEALLQTTETPEETQERQARWAQAHAENPNLSRMGAMGANLPFFNFSLGEIAKAMGGNRAALTNVGAAGAIGAGTEIAMAAARREPVEAMDVLASAAANIFMNRPTALGRRMGFPVDVVTPEMETTVFPKVPVRAPVESDIGTRGVTSTADAFAGVRRQAAEPTSAPEFPQSETQPIPLGRSGESPVEVAPEAAPETTIPVEEAAAPAPEADPAAPPAEPPPVSPEVGAPQPAPPGNPTSIKNAWADAERVRRGLQPMDATVPISDKVMMQRAADIEAQDPRAAARLVDELVEKPRAIETEEVFLILREQVRNDSDYNAAAQRLIDAKASGDEGAVVRAQADVDSAVNEGVRINNAMGRGGAGTNQGRAFRARQLFAKERKTEGQMMIDLVVAQRGEPLSKEQEAQVREEAKVIKESQKVLDEQAAAQQKKEVEASVDNLIAKQEEKDATVDPLVKKITDRVIARMNAVAKATLKDDPKAKGFFQTKADEAMARIVARRGRLQTGDPLNIAGLIDEAIVGANYLAKGVKKFGEWSKQMLDTFGDRIKPQLKALFNKANEVESESYRQFLTEDQQNEIIDQIAGGKKKEVATKIKAPLSAAAQTERITTAIGKRIEEGRTLDSLGAYVNKLAENLWETGIKGREPLTDAVHAELQKHDPNITREETMTLMSGFGKSTPLSTAPVKVALREIKGEQQQLLKLSKLEKGEPIPKTGPARRVPGVVERGLTKLVNAAKKKLGVKVTDPETQLKSSQDAIRTRLRNDIEDMTLELETGVKSPEQTPAEYTQDMEILKGVRDRVRQTLKEIEGNPNLTDEQRLSMAKRSAEDSLAMWERRLAGEQAKARKGITNPEIEAIKARRDAVKAQVEEIDAADAVLQENKKAEGLVRQIQSAEDALQNNAARTRTQGADTQLVAEAREQLRLAREALSVKRAADPVRQAEAIERAEQALEKSIKKLDADIASGNLTPAAKRTEAQSDRIAYLRAQREAMNKLKQQLRNEARPRTSAIDLAIKSRMTFLKNQTAELQRRAAAGDFAKREKKKPLDLSSNPKAVEALVENTAAREQFERMKYAAERAARGKVQRAWDATRDTVDAGTNLLTSYDLSALRQGILAWWRNPIQGTKNLATMVRAFKPFTGEAHAREINAQIMLRDNAKNGNYEAADLAITPLEGGTFSAKEENMAARLAEKIPGVRMSNRAFITFLNKMRADTMDALIDMHPTKNPTVDELKALGNYVNVATGRGNFGKFASAIPFLGRVYWSPRLLLSRIQYIAGQPLYKGTGFTRKVIAKEYARQLTGISAMYLLAQAAGWNVGLDSRSSDFGRIVTPDGTRIDPLGGLAQVMTLIGRLYHGETVSTQDEKVHSLTDEQSQFKTDAGDVLGRFNRSKLNPVAGTVWDVMSRRLYTGEPTTAKSVAVNALVPLSFRDLPENIREQGISQALTLWLLNMFGISAKTYEPK